MSDFNPVVSTSSTLEADFKNPVKSVTYMASTSNASAANIRCRIMAN
jgi:hypothetical protein